MNAPITFPNVHNNILYTEGNECDIIAIPFIESIFENEYIHILKNLSNQYIYGYLISMLIGSEATNQNII